MLSCLIPSLGTLSLPCPPWSNSKLCCAFHTVSTRRANQVKYFSQTTFNQNTHTPSAQKWNRIRNSNYFLVSQDDSEDVKLRRYIFLIVVSSTIILIITCSIFLVLRNDLLIGWLSLSITWSAALLSPILVTCLISSAWLVQSALSNGQVRIMAIKFLTYLTALTFTTISLVLSFLTIVNVDWILAILFLVTCLISVLCLAPQCHLVETRNTTKNANNMSNRQQNWLQIDNRSSLADFRYIPVVHNIHSQKYDFQCHD